MSTQPTSSSTASSRSSTSSSSTLPQNNDRWILIVSIILGVIGVVLVGFTIFLTVRLKRWRSTEASGPYQENQVHNEHHAAQTEPFGGGGPYSGRTIPKFKHTPGENMRIAFRRPDGAWNFADSQTPFAPAGVNDINIPPSATSSSASFFPPNAKLSNKEREVKAAGDLYKGYDSEFGFAINPTVPPPPAYHRESCNEHFARSHSPVVAVFSFILDGY